jgi:hypothetical protein
LLKEIIEQLTEEQELSPLQQRYQNYFRCWLAKYGVESPADFKDIETMKKFFNDVADNWNNGVGPKKDSPCQ